MASGKLVVLAIAGAALAALGVWIAVQARSSSDSAPVETLPSSARPPAGSAAPPPSLPAIEKRSKSKPVPAPVPVDPAVAKDLADPDPRVRLARLDQLLQEGDDVSSILAASRDRDEAVALLAIEGLGKLYAQGRVSLDDLAGRYEDRSLSAKARAAALDGIGAVSSERGARYLATLGRRGETDERRAVAMLLARQPRGVAVPALRELARDGDETVRLHANASLNALGAE